MTYECLMLGLEQAKPGNHLGDVAHAIQRHAERNRYGVVRDFCGHGLGRLFHDAPEVVHVGKPGTGPELKPGMIFTEAAGRRLDRRDARPLALRAVRTFDRHHGTGLGGVHPLARGAHPAAIPLIGRNRLCGPSEADIASVPYREGS